MQAQPGRRHDVPQKRFRERGEQVFLVVEVPVEHGGGLAGSGGDVGKRGAVKAALCEQLAGRLFDSRPGLAAFRGQDVSRH